MIQEILNKLQELQDVLAEKYSIENELKNIPKALNTKTELVNRLKKSFVEKNERLESGRAKVQDLRIKMTDAEREREKYEEQIVNINTQREYEALVKEIREASEREQNFRKDLQREQKYLEELQQSIEREESLIQEQEKELTSEQEKIKEESDKRQKLLETLNKQEDEITPGMDEEMVFKFKRIIRSKGGKGIVPLRRSVCTGCNMILPAQFVNDVKAEKDVLFCPYCSMILYHQPEAPEGEDILDFDDNTVLFDDDEEFDDDFSDDFEDKDSDDDEDDDFEEDEDEEEDEDDIEEDDDDFDDDDDVEDDHIEGDGIAEQSLEDVEEEEEDLNDEDLDEE
ncbi:zinc ribbon domain-containing protein [Salinispira pacifica]|uniref:RNA polymerase sigma factor RpoD n=1 Tax=Salinispira pacifica TaxID=1307761 RepID=V5WHY1_9SPIO|nr:C4-type zinc ribbon domain-containing protein [Salinispira pacifica]AHC15149.1 RNA polymerase sigma factor RpoD [Salinispira pacifica]